MSASRRRKTTGQRLTEGLVALGVVCLACAVVEWGALGLTRSPQQLSCEALRTELVPRWVEATDCTLDLQHAFVRYAGNTPTAYVPLAPLSTRGEVDVVLISQEPEVVAQILDEHRPRAVALPVLAGARQSRMLDMSTLRTLQAADDRLSRHTQYVLHSQTPDHAAAVLASLGAAVALGLGLPALVVRRRRQRQDATA